jgi:hypothetical protein
MRKNTSSLSIESAKEISSCAKHPVKFQLIEEGEKQRLRLLEDNGFQRLASFEARARENREGIAERNDKRCKEKEDEKIEGLRGHASLLIGANERAIKSTMESSEQQPMNRHQVTRLLFRMANIGTTGPGGKGTKAHVRLIGLRKSRPRACLRLKIKRVAFSSPIRGQVRAQRLP